MTSKITWKNYATKNCVTYSVQYIGRGWYFIVWRRNSTCKFSDRKWQVHIILMGNKFFLKIAIMKLKENNCFKFFFFQSVKKSFKSALKKLRRGSNKLTRTTRKNIYIKNKISNYCILQITKIRSTWKTIWTYFFFFLREFFRVLVRKKKQQINPLQTKEFHS